MKSTEGGWQNKETSGLFDEYALGSRQMNERPKKVGEERINIVWTKSVIKASLLHPSRRNSVLICMM